MRCIIVPAGASLLATAASGQDLVTIRNATIGQRSTFEAEFYRWPPYRRVAGGAHAHEEFGFLDGDGDLDVGFGLTIPYESSPSTPAGWFRGKGSYSGTSNVPIAGGGTRTTLNLLGGADIGGYGSAGGQVYVSGDASANWDAFATIVVDIEEFVTADLNLVFTQDAYRYRQIEWDRSVIVRHRRGTDRKAVAYLIQEFDMGSTTRDSRGGSIGFGDDRALPPGKYFIELATSASIVPSPDYSRINAFRADQRLILQFDNVRFRSVPPRCGGTPGWCADVDLDGTFGMEDLFSWLTSPVDTDGDEIVDAEPFGEDAGFLAGMLMLTEPGVQDCNANGFPDAYDIAIPVSEGGSADLDGDGVPDECDALCPADLDADGELTLFDFLEFQNLFDTGDPIADFDGDGELTLFDFLAFQNAFDAGCP